MFALLLLLSRFIQRHFFSNALPPNVMWRFCTLTSPLMDCASPWYDLHLSGWPGFLWDAELFVSVYFMICHFPLLSSVCLPFCLSVCLFLSLPPPSLPRPFCLLVNGVFKHVFTFRTVMCMRYLCGNVSLFSNKYLKMVIFSVECLVVVFFCFFWGVGGVFSLKWMRFLQLTKDPPLRWVVAVHC